MQSADSDFLHEGNTILSEIALKKVKSLVEAGELLDAIDFARTAAAEAAEAGRSEEVISLQMEEVLLLARISSLGEAQEKFNEYKLETSDEDRAHSLWARLKKDLGFEAENDAEKERLFRESLKIYVGICSNHDPEVNDEARQQFEYNAINAVTLSYLLDEPDAPGVAELVEKLKKHSPLNTYYSWATYAELLIALNSEAHEVQAALETAVAMPGGDVSARATTLRQLCRIAPNHPALEVLKPGPVLHFSGHIIAHPDAVEGRVLAHWEDKIRQRIANKLDEINPSLVIGSIAAGADILVLEEALRRGIRVRVGLPFDLDDFIASSIRPSGEDWVHRAMRILQSEKCTQFHLSKTNRVLDDNQAFELISRYAMGSAILYAERISTDVEQLLIWDAIETCGTEGVAADRRCWIASGRQPTLVDVSDCGAGKKRFLPAQKTSADRLPCAIVFGDVKNFSKLTEEQIPIFVDNVLGAVKDAMADVTARYGHRAVSFRNTWGDGVFAVFPEAAPAAFFAVRLQSHMTALSRSEIDLPQNLAIRLGLHFGPAYERIDPVTGIRNFFGEAVARAARIEPITIAGSIFVSEEFASELALDPHRRFHTEYVGEREAAKDYGHFRLYRLKEKLNKR